MPGTGLDTEDRAANGTDTGLRGLGRGGSERRLQPSAVTALVSSSLGCELEKGSSPQFLPGRVGGLDHDWHQTGGATTGS